MSEQFLFLLCRAATHWGFQQVRSAASRAASFINIYISVQLVEAGGERRATALLRGWIGFVVM